MTSTLRSLQTLIHASSLDKQVQKEFLELLSSLPDKILVQLLKMCQESPEWIEKLYQNYSAKKLAIANLDKNAWEKIIEEEVSALQ